MGIIQHKSGSDIKHTSQISLKTDDLDFTQKEIDAVFKSANSGKAPGTDGIPMEVIELLYREKKQLFGGILNKCLKEGVFLSSWKKADLLLFNKFEKDRTEASSYRPICLLSA